MDERSLICIDELTTLLIVLSENNDNDAGFLAPMILAHIY